MAIDFTTNLDFETRNPDVKKHYLREQMLEGQPTQKKNNKKLNKEDNYLRIN